MLTERKFINFFQKNNQKFLILGIGGVSMSSIALLLQKQGHEVCGYDSAHGAFTSVVESHGIPVVYNDEEISTDNVACAVYTSAIKEDSPLLNFLREKGIECIVRAEFLGELMKQYKNRIGISGTHGKSTVSGMLASIFMTAERDPTVMIGAGLAGLEGGFRAGGMDDYIFEACEYRDSFLSFSPTISVVLNVELDHTDYFKSLEQMEESFTSFMDISAENKGLAVINADSPNAVNAAKNSKCEKLFYSCRCKNADVFADNIRYNKGKASFDVFVRGEFFAKISLGVIGEFQVGNALAAISAAYLSGIDSKDIESALREYCGVDRRFQLRKIYNGAEVRDDYAHHPDEIRATLSAAKNAEYKNIYVIYQPHTYTRTHDLFDDFTKAFDGCREVIFADIYAAREQNRFGITSEQLAAATPCGKYVGDFERIAEYIKGKLSEGDLLIIMGAGNIINFEI